MTRRLGLLAAFAFSGLFWWWLFTWLSSALAVGQATWRDMPPPQYRGTGSAYTLYLPRQDVQRMCGQRNAVACTRGRTVFMPTQCSPTGTRGPQRETVNVEREMRDTGYCASVRAHEFGHVNGWSGQHER
jgi:hypothetical protein